jgi:hypothetical protein
MHLVKIACEMADKLGVSLSQWDATELARKLIADGVVESISPQTVQPIPFHHKLKPSQTQTFTNSKLGGIISGSARKYPVMKLSASRSKRFVLLSDRSALRLLVGIDILRLLTPRLFFHLKAPFGLYFTPRPDDFIVRY